MPRSLPWQRLWCSTEPWPFMKVCDKWATMNAEQLGVMLRHIREKETFSKQLFLLMLWIHTQML